MNLINARQLKQRLDAGERLLLINALDEHKFRAKHIPGSLNVFRKEDVEKTLKRNDHIVVYCTDQACNRSILMYYILEELGYEHIFRFPGGLIEWEDEGYPMEGERVH